MAAVLALALGLWLVIVEPRRDPQRVVDPSHDRPLPAPGTIEIWLPPPPPVAR